MAPNDDRPYYRIDMPAGVVVLPVTTDGRFVLIRQFRPTLGRYTLEFPAGGVDPDEVPERAMARELYEETGYRCTLREVGSGVLRLDRENVVNHFYLGSDARLDPDFVAQEAIETVLVTPEQFRDLVGQGQFDHIACLGLFPMARYKLGVDLLSENKTKR